MKKFEVYKHIRKRAVIFGLPMSLFALMMVSVVVSLLIIIFSFSFGIIISVLIFNTVLYIALFRISGSRQVFQLGSPFPKLISNKQNTGLNYED